jgi:Tol biopolymer transport system component
MRSEGRILMVTRVFLPCAIVLAVALMPVVAASGTDGPLVSDPRPGTWDIVSVNDAGVLGDGDSGKACGVSDGASMSDDDRYVAFTSLADNLDPGRGRGLGLGDVFVRDRLKGTTRMVSVDSFGALPEIPPLPSLCGAAIDVRVWAGARRPDISANGRFVTFSDDRTLTQGDDDINGRDVFVHDLRTSKTTIVSVTTSGEHVNGLHGAHDVAISGNGRFVAFTSDAYSLDEELSSEELIPGSGLKVCEIVEGVPGADCAFQVFVRDRLKKTTRMASVSEDGVPADLDVASIDISDDGRFVVFESRANNLGEDDRPYCVQTTGCSDIFVRDLKKGVTEEISVPSDSAVPSPQRKLFGHSYLPVTNADVITPDGRFIVFESGADLVPQAPTTGIYVRDRKTGRTEQVAVSSAGQLSRSSAAGSISDDGRYVFFSLQLNPGTVGCETAHEGQVICQGAARYDRKTGQTDWIWHSTQSSAFGSNIGAKGDTFLRWADDEESRISGDSNAATDVFVREVGISGLGVGGLLSPAARVPLSVPGQADFSEDGILQINDRVDSAAAEMIDADMTGVRLVYRPDLADLFVRVDVGRLPFAVGSPGLPLVYTVAFEAGGRDFEIRMSDFLTQDVGLFECGGGGCLEVSRLRFGIGTTGDSIVASLPLDLVGLENGGRIAEARAFSSFGTYLTGPLE